VINTAGRARYAIPFFFDPHPDTLIICLPSCRDAATPAKYDDITYQDYAVWYASRNYRHLEETAA
jgi:isopenicillin N synthase-like dioxygenase